MCKMFAAAGRFSSLSPAMRAKFHEFMSDLYRACAYDDEDQDAAGFYVWCGDRTHHDRSAGDQRHLIRTSKEWKKLEFNPGMLYMCHARGAMSDASDPKNNHPFVGSNFALMHEGWISNHEEKAKELGLTLQTATDSELYLQYIEARGGMTVPGMWDMLKLTPEPTAIALTDIYRHDASIWFGMNESPSNHEFAFYRIPEFNGVFLVSTDAMMTIAANLHFDEPIVKHVERYPWDVEPHVIYQMKSSGEVSQYHNCVEETS